MIAADMCWTSEPVQRLESADVLTFGPGELLAYVSDLQAETRWVRATLHQSLVTMAQQHDELARKARRIEALLREIGAMRRDDLT